MVGFMQGAPAMVHEFLWHRLVGALEKDPLDDDSCRFPLDPDALASGWLPPIYTPFNPPRFPVGLQRSQNAITMTLFEVPGYRNPKWVRETWPMPW